MLAVILVSDRFFVLPHLIVAYIYILSPLKMCHCIIQRFCLELVSLLLSSYALACEDSMGGELSGKGMPLDENCRCI